MIAARIQSILREGFVPIAILIAPASTSSVGVCQVIDASGCVVEVRLGDHLAAVVNQLVDARRGASGLCQWWPVSWQEYAENICQVNHAINEQMIPR